MIQIIVQNAIHSALHNTLHSTLHSALHNAERHGHHKNSRPLKLVLCDLQHSLNSITVFQILIDCKFKLENYSNLKLQ